MNEGELDAPQQVDATVQREEARVIVNEQAHTNGNLMPDNSRGAWDRVRLILSACSYVFTLSAHMCCLVLANMSRTRT